MFLCSQQAWVSRPPFDFRASAHPPSIRTATHDAKFEAVAFVTTAAVSKVPIALMYKCKDSVAIGVRQLRHLYLIAPLHRVSGLPQNTRVPGYISPAISFFKLFF